MIMRTLIALVLFGSAAFSQNVPQSLKDTAAKDGRVESLQSRESGRVRSLFNTVESALVAGDIGLLSANFAKQVSMTIRGSESGFFSSAQALTILKKFLSARKPTQFSFSRLNDSVPHPYATGRLDFVVRGSKESVQVYVSLALVDSGWVISQFNIY